MAASLPERLSRTTLLAGLPSRTASALSIECSYSRRRPATLADAMCGVTTTFGRSSSWCPAGSGSGSVTSRPAPGELPAVDRGQQRVVVDEHAAGAVDEVGARLHAVEGGGVEHAVGRGQCRRVDGDDVGACRARGRTAPDRHPAPATRAPPDRWRSRVMPSALATTATREAMRPMPTRPSTLLSSSRARPTGSPRRPCTGAARRGGGGAW